MYSKLYRLTNDERNLMKRPNLFSYATNELSQDAFICWLLAWASPEYREVDNGLHQCGIEFIRALFAEHGKTLPTDIAEIKIKKQYKNIDVLCIINGTYAVLIEDKIGTKHHSNQLARYLEAVKKNFPKVKTIIPVYYKTEDQSNYEHVINNEYEPFLRRDILDILSTYKGSNNILVDYRDRLQFIEDEVNGYKTKNISKWNRRNWTGFYMELQERFGEDGKKKVNWGYVANPNGGFLGFWWRSRGEKDTCRQYIQLEYGIEKPNESKDKVIEGKLCFKIEVKNKDDRKKYRSKWFKAIKERAKEYRLDLVKPNRFGNGKTMTVCQLNGDYRNSKNGIIDMDKTVEVLRKAEKLLESIQEVQ